MWYCSNAVQFVTVKHMYCPRVKPIAFPMGFFFLKPKVCFLWLHESDIPYSQRSVKKLKGLFQIFFSSRIWLLIIFRNKYQWEIVNYYYVILTLEDFLVKKKRQKMDTKKTRELQSGGWVLERMLDMNTVCSQKQWELFYTSPLTHFLWTQICNSPLLPKVWSQYRFWADTVQKPWGWLPSH